MREKVQKWGCLKLFQSILTYHSLHGPFIVGAVERPYFRGPLAGAKWIWTLYCINPEIWKIFRQGTSKLFNKLGDYIKWSTRNRTIKSR